jgi:hypothetical protein
MSLSHLVGGVLFNRHLVANEFTPITLSAQITSIIAVNAALSVTGNCFDNAPMESFWHSLKVEETHGQEFATRDQAKQCVFAYIEGWYNTTRMHSSLGYKSPTQFERDCVTESIKAANDSQSARLIKRAA